MDFGGWLLVGDTVNFVINLYQFGKDNNLFHLHDVSNGKRKQDNGWTAKKLD
jgi:hypothetical protein